MKPPIQLTSPNGLQLAFHQAPAQFPLLYPMKTYAALSPAPHSSCLSWSRPCTARLPPASKLKLAGAWDNSLFKHAAPHVLHGTFFSTIPAPLPSPQLLYVRHSTPVCEGFQSEGQNQSSKNCFSTCLLSEHSDSLCLHRKLVFLTQNEDEDLACRTPKA